MLGDPPAFSLTSPPRTCVSLKEKKKNDGGDNVRLTSVDRLGNDIHTTHTYASPAR